VDDLLSGEPDLSSKGGLDPQNKSSINDLINAMIKDGISLENCELMLMEAAVKKTGGNITKAAELLGVTRRQVAYRLEKEDQK
jgi:transcriptional regulator with GAF, ATPase, and Fis domain